MPQHLATERPEDHEDTPLTPMTYMLRARAAKLAGCPPSVALLSVVTGAIVERRYVPHCQASLPSLIVSHC
eukprot:2279487-Rhodomonas_salina.2